MQEILKAIDEVPGIVWVALIGAAVGLVGHRVTHKKTSLESLRLSFERMDQEMEIMRERLGHLETEVKTLKTLYGVAVGFIKVLQDLLKSNGIKAPVPPAALKDDL